MKQHQSRRSESRKLREMLSSLTGLVLSCHAEGAAVLDDAEFGGFAEHVGDVLHVHLGIDALAVGIDGVD